jgi:hypothetical protein
MIERIAKRWKGIRKVVGRRRKVLFDNRMFDMEERRRGLRVRLLVCVRESKRNREGKEEALISRTSRGNSEATVYRDFDLLHALLPAGLTSS